MLSALLVMRLQKSNGVRSLETWGEDRVEFVDIADRGKLQTQIFEVCCCFFSSQMLLFLSFDMCYLFFCIDFAIESINYGHYRSLPSVIGSCTTTICDPARTNFPF